jgi:microcystin-dependent protein
MAEPFVAEIRIFAGNFAISGWAFCDGQVLPISQNTALFSLIGTFYGGNGTSNFAPPNLQGAAPLGFGEGPGLSLYDLGETGGETSVTLSANNMPAHSHTLQGSSGTATSSTPVGHALAGGGGFGRPELYAPTSSANVPMNPSSVGVTGGGIPHNNMSPFLWLNFIIALQGVFPARG